MLHASGYARSFRSLMGKRDWYFMLLFSLLVWLLYPVKVFFVAAMLGIDVGHLTSAVSTYTAYLVSMLPLLPGGLGTFEGSMAIMFSIGGFDLATGIAIALLSRCITFWFPLIFSAGAAICLSLEGHIYFKGAEACKTGNPRGP